jgi:hypothetical protein
MIRSFKISLYVAAIGLVGLTSRADVILGSFQGASDPNNVGWVNPATGNSITNDAADSFVVGGVPGYAQSLQATGAGFNAGSGLELQLSTAQIAALNANSYLTFTISVPPQAGITAGYNQIYNLVINAPGFGFTAIGSGGNPAGTWGTYSQATGTTQFNQNGEPNFYFFNNYPFFSETVTFNYSSFLPAIQAGGEGYVQLVFQANNGGGAPNFLLYNNVELSTVPFGTVPEPSVVSLLGIGAASLLFRRRKVTNFRN